MLPLLDRVQYPAIEGGRPAGLPSLLGLAGIRRFMEQLREQPLAGAADAEYTIDDLARTAGTTVRNVRAYQDKGLLPPPERRGRAGVYTAGHLARLRLIGNMLERGYTLASIGELLEAWVSGHDIGQLLGLEDALTKPWSNEVPEYYTLEEFIRLFASGVSSETLSKALALELIVPEKDRFCVPSPRLLRVGIELVESGIPLDEMMNIVAMLRENVERASNELISRVAKYVFDIPYGANLPPAEDAEKLASVIWRLRPLVDMAIQSEVERAMHRALDNILGDRLTAIYQHLQKPAGED